MWELDQTEGWVPKNWYSWALVLDRTLESPLDCQEIKPVNPKYNQPWILIRRTDAEAPIFGYLMQRANSFEKTLILGKIQVSRRRGWQRARWLDGITDSMAMSLSSCRRWWRTRKPGVLQSLGSQIVSHDWVTKQQRTTTLYNKVIIVKNTVL